MFRRGQYLGLGITGRRFTTVLPEQTAVFGANTISGAGGFRPLALDGASELTVLSVVSQVGATRTWSVSSGRLVANGTPDVDNGKAIVVSTSVGNVTCNISTVADTHSVSTLTELMAIPWIATSYSGAGGKALLRYGDYNTRSQNWSNRLNGLTTPATIASHNQNLRPKLTGWHSSVVSDTTFEWLWFHMPWDTAITERGGYTSFRSILGSTGSDITIKNCAFTSDMSRAREYPDEWITEERLQATLGRPFIFGCEMDGDNITIQDCEFYKLTHGIYFEGSNCIAQNNLQHDCWGDMFEQYGKGSGTTGNNQYLNNILIDPCSEQHNVHADFLQVGTPAGTHSDITIRGNIVLPGWEGRRNSAIVPLSFAQASGFLITSNTTLDSSIVTNQLVWVDTSGGPVTVTLPAASAGKNVIVHKVDSSTNAVTVVTQGGDTYWSTDYPSLNGQSTYTSARRFGALRFMNFVSGANDYRYREGADSLQAIILQGSGDFLDWNVEGNIIALAGWTGITFEVARIGAGSSRCCVRYNTLFGPYPDDITGDGLITVADGLGPVSGPYIELPSGPTNTGYRNIFGAVRNSSGSTFVESNIHGGANLTAYSSIFETVGSTFMLEPAKVNYNDTADDGGPNIASLSTRLTYLREYVADRLLVKSGVTQGAVGTSRTNGFMNWDTMEVNSPDPTILNSSGNLGTIANDTPATLTLVADKPVTWSVTGTGYSITGDVLTLAAQTTAGTYPATVTATDSDGKTDTLAITALVEEGEGGGGTLGVNMLANTDVMTGGQWLLTMATANSAGINSDTGETYKEIVRTSTTGELEVSGRADNATLDWDYVAGETYTLSYYLKDDGITNMSRVQIRDQDFENSFSATFSSVFQINTANGAIVQTPVTGAGAAFGTCETIPSTDGYRVRITFTPPSNGVDQGLGTSDRIFIEWLSSATFTTIMSSPMVEHGDVLNDYAVKT